MKSILQNQTIVLTRSLEQSKDFAKLLNREKANIIVAPVIKIIPLPLTEELKDIFLNIEKFDFVLFTSANAVRYFFYFLLRLFQKIHPKSSLKFACLGEKTAKTLKDYGYRAHFTGQTRTGQEFIEAFLKKYGNGDQRKIFIPVSLLADTEKFDILKNYNWQLIVKPIYNTVPNHKLPPGLREQILQHDKLILTFFSPSAFSSFIEFLPLNQFKQEWKIAAIGKTTQKKIEEHGLRVDIVPERSTAEELLQAIKKHIQKENAV